MNSEAYADVLQELDCRDEELQDRWEARDLKSWNETLRDRVSSAEWYEILEAELIYRGFCFRKEEKLECADRGESVAQMCPGCRSYWEKAAGLAGKSPEAWVAECCTTPS